MCCVCHFHEGYQAARRHVLHAPRHGASASSSAISLSLCFLVPSGRPCIAAACCKAIRQVELAGRPHCTVASKGRALLITPWDHPSQGARLPEVLLMYFGSSIPCAAQHLLCLGCRFDMGGSGGVLGAAKALSLLKPEGVEVHFCVASCENMIDGKGMLPGDILKAANGKTVEVSAHLSVHPTHSKGDSHD